jgi:tRNA (guanine37-N1)-methyltransferase
VIGRALEKRLIEIRAWDLRDHASPPHWKVDDEPFGGGAGMVFKPEPLAGAIEMVRGKVETPGPTIFLSPQGEPLTHEIASEFATHEQLTLVCGRYEGIDQRIRDHLVDREISIGDYVLTGGELPAMVLIEATARLLPEVLGDPDSSRYDSFVSGILDHPHYTRPAEYRGWTVPDVLRSGDHARIDKWRHRSALRLTALRRPELLADLDLDDDDRAFVAELLAGSETDREN